MVNRAIYMPGHAEFVFDKFSAVEVRHDGRIFDIHPRFEVLLSISMPRGSVVVLIVWGVLSRA